MSTTETIRIEDLAKWSTGKRVETKNGPRNLRTAVPTDKFWSAWRSDKQTLKDAGISCNKNRMTGNWQVCWWMPLSEDDQRQLDDAQAASRAEDADIAIPSPTGLEYLPYQRAGIAYAASRPATLIADEMGLGKTIEAIGVINADTTIKKVLVVCPASLRLNWRRELEKWLTRPMGVAIVTGGKPKDWPAGQFSIVIINYDILSKHRKRIDEIEWDLLVADEIHYCKNQATARTKAVFGHKTKKGEVKQTPIKARQKLYLTGTPIVNRPLELWPLVESADPNGLGRNFFAFAKKYCDAHHNGFGWDFKGAKNLELLQRLLRERFMVRRLKKDVLTELPSKRRQVIELPANGATGAVAEERRVYDGHKAYIAEIEERLAEIEQMGEVELDDLRHTYGEDYVGELRRGLAASKKTAFTEMSLARHAVALAKVPKVIEHLETALEGGPVVCFGHHRDVIALIADHFGDQAVTLTGASSMEDRQAAVDTFQAGKAKLFIGNIQAAGVGITLTASSHVVFAELDWVPGNLSQAEDRCHRIGQHDSVLVQHLVLENSVDAEMVETLIHKQEVIDAAMNDLPARKPETTPEAAPVRPHRPETTTVTIQPDPKDEAAEALTAAQIEAIHEGLRLLAGACDGALALDGCGFNKFDSQYGKGLAANDSLTPRQALAGQKLCIKYGRQLSDDLMVIIKA